jgi:hypothetical protein
VDAGNLLPENLTNTVSTTVAEKTARTFNFKVGGLDLVFSYWQIGLIILLIFLLFMTFARIRYLYVHWSIGKNATAFLFWGFLLAVIMEGFLLIGGRTLFTEILGWKNPPKPIAGALDFSREKLISVLGVKDEIPQSYAESSLNTEDFTRMFESLSSEEKENVRSSICTPQLGD